MEFMFIITAKWRQYEERKHLHYPGSLRSNCMGPVSLPAMGSLWHASYGHRIIFSHGEVR